MLDKAGKKRIEDWVEHRKRNPGRLVYIIYRRVHEWASRRWKQDGWENLQPDHLRLISIIGAESMSNNELAQRAKVSKQAMSKMVVALEKFDFIDVQPDPNDSRAKLISISKNGSQFLTYFNNCGGDLIDDFASIIGPKKTEQLINLLSELAEGYIDREKAEFDKK